MTNESESVLYKIYLCEIHFFDGNNDMHILQILDMSHGHLMTLPEQLLVSQSRLEKWYLSDNQLSDFTANISHMHNFTFLDLSHNQIQFFSSKAIQQMERHARASEDVFSVDIMGNPLSCTCASRQFLLWLKRTAVNFNGRLVWYQTMEAMTCYGRTSMNRSFAIAVANLNVLDL